MVVKSKSRFGFFGRLLRYLLYLFIASMVYLLVCKWVFPPITITQATAVFSGYSLKRDYVGWSRISPHVKLAAIASEDQLFPMHGGFDWKAIERSVHGKAGKKGSKRRRGAAASTISQQTAKNVFLWQGSGVGRYIRKVPEAFYTKAIELVWGKQRILEVYLNVAEMGPGIFGIEAAARHYFKKPAKDLSRREAAMIIAALPNPKKFTVVPASRRVQWRAPQIMRQMNNLKTHADVKQLID